MLTALVHSSDPTEDFDGTCFSHYQYRKERSSREEAETKGFCYGGIAGRGEGAQEGCSSCVSSLSSRFRSFADVLFSVAPWASAADVEAHYSRLHKLKADLICELIGVRPAVPFVFVNSLKFLSLTQVAIMRSEFAEAERHLAELIAHTRNQNLFNLYSARITLLHAHLAHGLNQTERALRCYEVAAYLSRQRTGEDVQCEGGDYDGVEDAYLHTAARAGEIWLRIGLLRREVLDLDPDEVDEDEVKTREEALGRVGGAVVRDCEGLGSTLSSVACILRACLTTEFLQAKFVSSFLQIL